MLKIVGIFGFLAVCFTANAQIVSLDSVAGYLGKNVTLYGRVDDGRYLSSSSNQPTLLNMGGKYPNQKITIVIYGPDRVNFGYKPEEMLLNKNVYVTGLVQLYNGKPQIQIKDPFSISFSAPGAVAASVQQAEDKIVSARQSKVEEIKATKEPKKQLAERHPKIKSNEVVNNTKPTTMQLVQSPTIGVNQEFALNSNVSLRGGPGNNFNTIGTLKKGTLVRVVSASYGWVKLSEKVSSSGNAIISGYVKADKLD